MAFFKRYWKRAARKKGLFGGDIKSNEEIQELNDKIEAQEEKEFKEFEEDFDEELEEVYDKSGKGEQEQGTNKKGKGMNNE